MNESQRHSLRIALSHAYSRIQSEDYVGTCGDCAGRRKCECKIEHDRYVSEVAKGLTILSEGWKRFPDAEPATGVTLLVTRMSGAVNRTTYLGGGEFANSRPGPVDLVTHWKPDEWEPLIDPPEEWL